MLPKAHTSIAAFCGAYLYSSGDRNYQTKNETDFDRELKIFKKYRQKTWFFLLTVLSLTPIS
jgi:hypothetical protein